MLLKAQLEINQGATFRRTFTCDLSDVGIPDIGAWATLSTFTLAVGRRGDFNMRWVASMVGDVHRILEGGWELSRATNNGQNGAQTFSTIGEPSYAALIAALSSLRKLPLRVLAWGSGLWTAGTVLAGVTTSPEVLSVLYRSRVNISWTGATVGVMVANDIVDAGGVWGARIVSINYGAKTAVLSLWTGTAADAALITSGGNSIALVSVGAFAGTVTGYQSTVTPGVFAPKAPGVAGIYNCIGARQDVTNGSRFPLDPADYDLSIQLPQWKYVDAASMEIELRGFFFNDIPGGDVPKLEVALALGTSIFREAELDVDRPKWMRFETTQIPTVATLTPFVITLRLSTSRRPDRTQEQIGVMVFETSSAALGGAGALRAVASAAVDLEDGFDDVEKTSWRNVCVWLAVSPAVATANQMYFNVHSWQTKLIANERAND